MLIAKMPGMVQALFPRLLWHKGRDERVIYLTFDDGPTPGITDWVLDTLDAHGAKATFFCIGDKVGRHPETLARVADAGHTIGNHTQHHRNLWRTPLGDWLADVAQCQSAIQSAIGLEPTLFRPPYGKITPRAASRLRPQFQVVMWDVICGDWNASLSPERVAAYATSGCRAGSILVMHDSDKAGPRMQAALTATLEHFGGQGYLFLSL
jgi:peptidoglycan/xylan/chitin deacetylase (PgdA/CDA1 family)